MTAQPPDDGSMPAWAVKIYTELAHLNAVLPKHTDWAEQNIKDHEMRLRVLEQESSSTSWIPKIAWILGTAVATYLVTKYLK